MATLLAGSTCVVTRDIIIGNQVAFVRGERVTVQKISPNPQRPDYKYVVFSPRLHQRFQLSDADINPYMEYQAPQRYQQSLQMRYMQKPRRTVPWKILGIVGGAIVLVVVVVVVLVVSLGGGGGPEEALNRYIQALAQKNTAVIYELTPNKTKEYISQGDMIKYLNYLDLGDMSHIRVVNIEISGDDALSILENTDTGNTIYVPMLCEDGKWKVDVLGSTSAEEIYEYEDVFNYYNDDYYDYDYDDYDEYDYW